MRDALRGPLRSAASAAFVVGTLLFLLNPPSLSGAEDLVAILLGATALMIVTAWVTVALAGDGPTEAEIEQVTERSERLAAQPPPEAPPTEFDALVEEAIDALPAEFRELLEDTPVVISHLGREHRAYGHYMGDTVARETYPDRIVIYRDTLERDFGHDPELLRAQVERTLRHEVAHHLGWGEKGVQGLGL
ncbi:MAG: metallopeptidase family protein [Thermoleophilaceae bacterium]